MVKFVVGIILAIAILVLGVFVYSKSQTQNLPNPKIDVSPTIINSPTPTSSITIPPDFKTYTSENFSVKYDPKMMIRNEAPGYTSFVLVGPTQKGQTELYDGINFVVQTGIFSTATLREFVDEEIENLKKDGTSRLSEGVISVTVGSKNGYEYKSRSLGEFRQIYLEGSDKKYAHVTLLLEDPSNAGFQKIVDVMLQTLTF